MPAPLSQWTDPDTSLFEAGDRLRDDEFLENVLQPLMWLGTDHDHSGDDGDGGLIATSNPLAVGFYSVGGAPFA